MRREWLEALRPAVSMLALFTILTGVLYPLAIWISTHDLFAFEAEGSLVRVGDRVVGSSLIGQPFTSPGYVWGRPSAASGGDTTVVLSSGSNLGPSNPALTDAVRARIAALRAADSTLTGPIPVDLVTASASGVDPDVSPAAARIQAPRIARARGVPVEAVRAVIERHVEGPAFGVLGEARVNVLAVNLDLDRALPRRGAP